MLTDILEHDVLCCVEVPVENRSALYTAIYFGGAQVILQISTTRTSLRRVILLNLMNTSTTELLCLHRQAIMEGAVSEGRHIGP